VLDSSVLVSLWSRIVLGRIAADQAAPYVPAWSEWIIAETWRILALRWLTQVGEPFDLAWPTLTQAANTMLRQLLPVMRFVSLRDYHGSGPWPELRDTDDVPIWQTAVLAGGRYVVSQNTRHFPPLVEGHHVYRDIEYLTAIEFIEDVLGKDAAEVYQAPLPAAAALRSGRSR
jgi:hypothetical protein